MVLAPPVSSHAGNSSHPTLSDTVDVLREFLTRLLSSAQASAIDSVVHSEIAFSHFRTLLVLEGHNRPLALGELADILELSVAAAGRNVDKLVQLHLVDRREDDADRRIKRVSLTVEGRAMISGHTDRTTGEISNFVARLPDDLRTELHSLLNSVVTGDYLDQPSPAMAHRTPQKEKS